MDIVASPQTAQKITHCWEHDPHTHRRLYMHTHAHTLTHSLTHAHTHTHTHTHARTHTHRGGLIIIRLPRRWWKNEQICQLPKETEDSSHSILSLSLSRPPSLQFGGGGFNWYILSVTSYVIVTMVMAVLSWVIGPSERVEVQTSIWLILWASHRIKTS